jgi:3-dehydroquinate dehydratase / shikimate dehydrogenase
MNHNMHNMTTPISIPISVTDAAGAITQMQHAVNAGATMVELRCDQAPAETITAVLTARPRQPDGSPLPAIVTIRLVTEGGQYRGEESHRLRLFQTAIQTGANFIDIEWLAWTQNTDWHRPILELCKTHGCKLILSRHDFAGRFAQQGFEKTVEELRSTPAGDILKIVWTPSTVVDAIDALHLTQEQADRNDRPLLALTMGQFGQLSRLLGAKFGQPFTFATLPGDGGTAPGQPSITDLVTSYRWNQQLRDTKVFGVIGWPVGHSMSPAIHNAGFDDVGINAVYLPIPVQPSYEEFKAVVDALRSCPNMHLGGLSITIPHKENALRYVRDNGGTVDALSDHIGVVNTIVFHDHSLYGLNSDFSGALDALTDAMQIQRDHLAGQRVAVLGAGGAARAIVAGLAFSGATVVVYNRNLERARQLAADFDGQTGKVIAAPLEKLCDSCCRIYINATPLGMYPHVDRCPVDFDPDWSSDTVVFDTIYNPLQTKLLQLAASKGALTISGLEMFVRQAATQFQHFTGQPAPMDIFRNVVRQRLEA